MKKKIALLSLLMALFLLPIHGFAYTVNHEFALGANEGSSQLAQNRYIIVHDTANPNASGRNEATYMKRNWRNAYTSHIVGDGIVYQVGEPGYVSYGALNANPYAPAQIELQATPDKVLFAKNYAVYVDLIRDLCNQFGIPKTLDNIYGTNGAKSHLWVTNNFGGDHTDPYGYLASMGISKAQFANDIANGLNNQPNKPTPPDNNSSVENEVKYLRVKESARVYGRSSQGRLIPNGARNMAFTVIKRVPVAYDNRVKYEYLVEYHGKREWVISTDVTAVNAFDPQVIQVAPHSTNFSPSSQHRATPNAIKGKKYTVQKVHQLIFGGKIQNEYLIKYDANKPAEWILEQDAVAK